MEIVFLDCGGFIVRVDDAYVSDDEDDEEPQFVISHWFKEKIYIQVAYILTDDSVIEREFGAFKNIEDNYPKYVLTMDKFDFSQNGIIHKNVIDWLLEE